MAGKQEYYFERFQFHSPLHTMLLCHHLNGVALKKKREHSRLYQHYSQRPNGESPAQLSIDDE